MVGSQQSSDIGALLGETVGSVRDPLDPGGAQVGSVELSGVEVELKWVKWSWDSNHSKGSKYACKSNCVVFVHTGCDRDPGVRTSLLP